MVGSKDLQPSTAKFLNVFIDNQFYAKPQWPAPDTDLSGKTAIITGGNTGLGYETASQLLDLKLTHLILAVRAPEKGNAAATSLLTLHPGATIEVWPLDLSSYESIRAFTRRAATLPKLDMALLNAGILNFEFRLNPSTHHEEMFQINYLSTALLALLLLPILKAKHAPNSPPARLTIVNAALSLVATFPTRTSTPKIFTALDDPHNFNRDETYNTSKLLAHMFLWKIADEVSADDVIVNLADPAWVKGTQLARESTGLVRWGLKLFELCGRTKRVGAACFVHALVGAGREGHGAFLMSWRVHPFAAMLYTDEGKGVIERVWEETMGEFEFAGVRDMVGRLRG
ncbi:NAD(P)-binding protein [Ophiobolus disseminans]|uniref:NAD(P)-binding protein n=1 Tax=Ophiobolus disseminans TaxID=1469910 RepID=A0A6A7AMP0_9PLEO|nr:NAD(P)-binding protein [Ophiobolus disseminans]